MTLRGNLSQKQEIGYRPPTEIKGRLLASSYDPLLPGSRGLPLRQMVTKAPSIPTPACSFCPWHLCSPPPTLRPAKTQILPLLQPAPSLQSGWKHRLHFLHHRCVPQLPGSIATTQGAKLGAGKKLLAHKGTFCFCQGWLCPKGLALLLVMMEHVPRELKAIFSIFGFASFVEGLCTTVFTALATQCAKTTPELYYLSVTLSVSSVLTTAFFSIVGIFWFANMASPGLILNKKAKTGICYEPASECSCLWHV